MSRHPNSTAAFDQIQESGALPEMHWTVYETLFRSGPMTRNELDAARSDHPNPCYSRRLVEMERAGALHRVGKARCRISGFVCDLWDVTSKVVTKADFLAAARKKDHVRVVIHLATLAPAVAEIRSLRAHGKTESSALVDLADILEEAMKEMLAKIKTKPMTFK